MVMPPQRSERLLNEFETLDFIAARTTIPVLKIVAFKKVWGAYQLVVERVRGISLDCIQGVERANPVLNAERFITTTVIPQLQSLKSHTMGAVIGTVILPDRITSRDDREKWRVRSECTSKFSFCHNNLAQHNTLIDPDTLQVIAIIDWEVSGFYNPEFEAPLWAKAWYEPGYHDIGSDSVPSLIQFLVHGQGYNQRSSDDLKVVRTSDASAAEA
ncbi:MAG: hypothetical protein Q9215_004061 [Flavoplaca cf. flavocitrina]